MHSTAKSASTELTLIVADRHCGKCRAARKTLAELRERFAEVRVREIRRSDPAAAALGVILTPALLVDGQVFCMGRRPPVRRIEALLTAKRRSAASDDDGE